MSEPRPGPVRVARIGLTPVKGMRHQPVARLRLGPDGPEGDRVLCVVDPRGRRVLKTVQHPRLLAIAAQLGGDRLQLTLPDEVVAGSVQASGGVIEVDYWGRPAPVRVVPGPWAKALSAHLGLPVELAQVQEPGAVVYGAEVTVVSAPAVRRLWRRLGLGDGGDAVQQSARFRATFTVDGPPDHPLAADDLTPLVGCQLTLGSATLQIGAEVARCAVLNHHPTGATTVPVLRGLRRDHRGEPVFGCQATVVRPGDVAPGALVSMSLDETDRIAF